MYFTCSLVIGDSDGNLQFWSISRRILVDSHKAHDGDILSISVFTYQDASRLSFSSNTYPSTIIVTGGVDGKVNLSSLSLSLALCLP